MKLQSLQLGVRFMYFRGNAKLKQILFLVLLLCKLTSLTIQNIIKFCFYFKNCVREVSIECQKRKNNFRKLRRKLLLQNISFFLYGREFLAQKAWHKVWISPTFYKLFFLYEIVLLSFSVLTVCVCNFLAKGNWQKNSL